ncbi:hypothetical protein [Granulicella mallensis]|uniref:hypothetical protein n=1 Tax=Granulicella mallensis TaxID=940614 RepID=UPI0026D0225E
MIAGIISEKPTLVVGFSAFARRITLVPCLFRRFALVSIFFLRLFCAFLFFPPLHSFRRLVTTVIGGQLTDLKSLPLSLEAVGIWLWEQRASLRLAVGIT